MNGCCTFGSFIGFGNCNFREFSAFAWFEKLRDKNDIGSKFLYPIRTCKVNTFLLQSLVFLPRIIVWMQMFYLFVLPSHLKPRVPIWINECCIWVKFHELNGEKRNAPQTYYSCCFTGDFPLSFILGEFSETTNRKSQYITIRVINSASSLALSQYIYVTGSPKMEIRAIPGTCKLWKGSNTNRTLVRSHALTSNSLKT